MAADIDPARIAGGIEHIREIDRDGMDAVIVKQLGRRGAAARRARAPATAMDEREDPRMRRPSAAGAFPLSDHFEKTNYYNEIEMTWGKVRAKTLLSPQFFRASDPKGVFPMCG